MFKIEHLEAKIRLMGREIEELKARLFYLSAPKAKWNDIEECWMFIPTKNKCKKIKKSSPFWGNIEFLEVSKEERYNEKNCFIY